MTKHNIDQNRIEKYIEKIESVNEGDRDNFLYRTGLLLRRVFALMGSVLLHWLRTVNESKCDPPLPDKEVVRIARSVDKSNAPLGEGVDENHAPSNRHKSAGKYTVTVAESPIAAAVLLEKVVSLYTNCKSNTPEGEESIGTILNAIRTGGYDEKTIERIHAIRNEPDKGKRSKLKEQMLGATMHSESQLCRKADHCRQNGMLTVDVDGLPMDKSESAKTAIAALPYVLAVGLSVSGTGLFALIAYEGTPDLKALLTALQTEFPYPLDMACSDVSRLRFMSIDENIIVKDEVYPVALTEQIEEVESESAQVESPKQWQPFPLETLPVQLRHFVIEVSRSIGIDAANTAACVLSIISGVGGRTFQFEIKPGYREHTMLWVVLVADSGFGKSPALDFARKPIDRLQIDAEDRYKLAMEKHDADSEEYQRQQRSKKKSDKEANAPLFTPVMVKPIEPTMQRYSVSDATTEALIPIMSANPYGVSLIRDELAAFFGGLDAYRGGKVDKQIYIEIHGGRFVQSDRKTNRSYISAKTPSLSIIGGIQSEVIRDTIRTEPQFLTTGFGARFLMVYPPTEPIRWNHNVVDPEAICSYEMLIEALLRYRERFTPDEPCIVSLTPEAKALIFDFQNRHADESLGVADGNVRYVENKAGMHCARLALVLHIVKSVESGTDPVSPVTSETMEQAIVLTEWFLNEAHRIYAMLAGEHVDGTLTPDQQEVMRVLARLGKPSTKREIYRKSRPCERLQKAQQLDGILSELVRMKKVQEEFREGDGVKDGIFEYTIR